ncbi:MAG: nitroreductase family protein [Candidatus Fermentibacteraceae bacterium]
MRFYPEKRFITEACTGCGTCSRVCPSRAVQTGPDKRVTGFMKTCIGCGHCGAYCPVNAFGLENTVRPGASPEELTALFRTRRSCRLFKSEPLTGEKLKQLLDPVGFAPTGTNSQGVTVIAVQGMEAIQRLAVNPVRKFLRPFAWLAKRSSMREYIGDFMGGGDPITHRAPCLLLFFVPRKNTTPGEDGVIAATMVSLTAEAMGLGCLWNGVVKAIFPFLTGLRKLKPGGTALRAVLCVGERTLAPLREVPERDWKNILTNH